MPVGDAARAGRARRLAIARRLEQRRRRLHAYGNGYESHGILATAGGRDHRRRRHRRRGRRAAAAAEPRGRGSDRDVPRAVARRRALLPLDELNRFGVSTSGEGAAVEPAVVWAGGRAATRRRRLVGGERQASVEVRMDKTSIIIQL